MRPGPGVDRVMTADRLLFENEYFDTVVCTEMLEHDPAFWRSLPEMGRVLKPGGSLLLTTRGNGFPEHGYPDDYWRFMPQSGRVLCQMAGLECVESIVDPELAGILVHGRKAE